MLLLVAATTHGTRYVRWTGHLIKQNITQLTYLRALQYLNRVLMYIRFYLNIVVHGDMFCLDDMLHISVNYVVSRVFCVISVSLSGISTVIYSFHH